MIGKYKTPAAFQAALNARLKREAETTGRPFQRILNVYLMERFLARVVDEFADAVTIKGGMALEFRLERARATKDIDLRMEGDRDRIVERLRHRVAKVGAWDGLTFTIDNNPDDPDIDGDGVIYEGVRLRAHALFAEKRYGSAFGVDVAIGDPMTGRREYRTTRNVLDIVGAPSVEVPLYPIATHLAEKLHAYTLPRARVNFRLKDLVDIALIAAELTVDGGTLRAALDRTFSFRGSHALPSAVPRPAIEWTDRYPKERDEQGLSWPSVDDVYAEAARFLDPVLAAVRGTWDPRTRSWT
jgi:hypothetical protein